MKRSLKLTPGGLTLHQLNEVYTEPFFLEVDDACVEKIAHSRRTVDRILQSGRTAYGINTGFGRLAQSRIDETQLAQLQTNLILSHATGVGALLNDECVRLVLLLKINALAQGFSGISPAVFELLVKMFNNDIYPAIPGKGSVGASGDLAPLAHLSLPLIGRGQVRVAGTLMESVTAFRGADLIPVELAAKDGLGLLNGTQVSTALALSGLFQAQRNVDAAFMAGSMSVEAALGSRVPFDARIHRIRRHPGQVKAAEIFRDLLADSEIGRSHEHCDRVQDPYSLRCQPQVMGACLDQLKSVARCLQFEANAVSDNPLVFEDTDEILSGGNFHAEPVAMAADNLALVIAEVGALSERRMALLIDSSLSQLPPFLVDDAGLNSGFMIAQVTAAALASENKSLAHPASVDSLPTSANQEDHVSMATFAARRLADMNENTRYILAVELLAAAQGIDLRRPMRSNNAIEQMHATVRGSVRKWEQDRYFQPDLEAVACLIQAGQFGDRTSEYLETRS